MRVIKFIRVNSEKGNLECFAIPENVDTIKQNLEMFGLNPLQVEEVLVSIESEENDIIHFPNALIEISNSTTQSEMVH